VMFGGPPSADNRPSLFDRRLYDRSASAASGALSEEDKDTASTLGSTSMMGDSQHPSVIGLRDRLLREARNERQRCLDVAEATERKRAEFHSTYHVGTQTDPVVIMDASGGSGGGGLGTTSALGSSALFQPGMWSASDEMAQSDALRTIAMLGERGNQSQQSEGRVAEVEAQLRAERASRQECETQVTHERNRKEAAQQQVLCLEYELDGKEAALQVAERTLERRDTDLQQAQLQLRALQESNASIAAGHHTAHLSDDVRCKALQAQLLEREQQLDLKDQHISRLLNVLRQHRSIFVDDDSTVCGNERAALTYSNLATLS